MSEMTPAIQTPTQTDLEMMWKLSQRVGNTPFVPTALRGKPESVLACILYGSELGLGPMQSLNSIHVIEGRTAMSPELMRAMVARHGHRIDVLQNTNEVCEVKGVRADTGSTATVRWSIEDARLAGLAGKNNWKTYPRAMLLARATSELCRIVFPDVIAGLSYTPEEVASIEGVEYTPVVEEEPTIVEEPVSDIVDAEIVEDEPIEEEKAPAKKKAGEKVKMKTVSQLAEDAVPSKVDENYLTFDQRLAEVESWGGWPWVMGIAKMKSKTLGCEPPTNAYQLANNVKLYEMVRAAVQFANAK